MFEIPCKKRMGSCTWFSVGDFIHLFFRVRQLIADIPYTTSTSLLLLPYSYPLRWVIIHCHAEPYVLQFLSHIKANSFPSLSQAVILSILYCPHAGMGASGQQEGRGELFSAPQESYILGIPEVMTPLVKTGESCRAVAGCQASVSNPFSLRISIIRATQGQQSLKK